MKFGPQYGYSLKPEKLYHICKAEDEDTASQAFESFGLNINYWRGQHYLGGFIGSAEKKDEWLAGLVEKWVATVETLSIVAEWFPQTAYTSFTYCMQNKWQYVQQVVANTASFFAPLEAAICMHLLPALLGVPLAVINGKYRQLLTHSVKLGGAGNPQPCEHSSKCPQGLPCGTLPPDSVSCGCGPCHLV